MIPNVKAMGKSATKVVDILKRIEVEDPVDISNVGIHFDWRWYLFLTSYMVSGEVNLPVTRSNLIIDYR